MLSAAVHIPDPSGQADRALIEGTPENFTRVCRGHAGRAVQMLCPRLDRDFHVPPDGVWMINGIYAVPGELRQLVEGDQVIYHRVVRAPDNDAPTQKLPFIRLSADRRTDPETGRRIRFLTPEQAIAEGRRRGLL